MVPHEAPEAMRLVLLLDGIFVLDPRRCFPRRTHPRHLQGMPEDPLSRDHI
jgi:hypothetical protein